MHSSASKRPSNLLTEQHSADFGGVETLPNHGNDGTGSHVLDHPVEKRLGGQIGVMKLHVIDGGLHELHRDQLETATRLETLIRGKGMQEVKAQKVIMGKVKRTRTEG